MTRLFPADRAAVRPHGRSWPAFATVLLCLLSLTAARAGATDSLEPNNTAGEARRLTSGSPITSYVSSFGDLDYYVIAFGQAGNISIQLSSVPNDADYVLSLYSFDAQGSLVDEGVSDQGGNGGDESLSGQVSGAGVSVIEVSGYLGAFNADDSYQLSAVFPTGWPGSGQDGNEPNDDPTVATALTSQVAKSGLISQPGDVDFYRVTLSTSNNITVDVTSLPASTDYDVRFYAVNGGVFEPIAESLNEAGLDEHLEVTEAAPGTYYVAVFGFGGAYNSSDSYSIVANFGGGGGGNQPPTIALSAPNGGESWQVGSQHSVTWTASDPNAGDALQISLEYSANGGGQWTSIVSGLSNSGSYNWTVPNSPSTQARVRATVSDGQVQAQDESNANFTIASQPAGQNTLAISTGSGQSGTQVTVQLTLDNDDAVKGLQTDISFDPAVVSYNIGQGTSRGATMTYSAAVIGGNKVRVLLFYQTGDVLAAGSGAVANLTFNLVGAGGTQSALTPSASVLSDASGNGLSVTNQAGSISVTGGGGAASPVVSLSAPNGGESWQAGTVHNILYTATDADTPSNQLTIRYEYSTNAGTSWTLISDAQSNSGAFSWTVPNNAGTQCRARVTASDGVRTGSDASDANFAITAAPAGSNVLAVGTGNGASGGEVTIPLTLDNDDPIKALQTDLHFTSSILSYEASSVGDHAPGMILDVNLVDPGTLRIVMHYENTSVITAGSGTIANITFSLLTAGTSPVTPQASVLSNAAGQAVSVTEQAGSVTVTGGGGGQAPSITLVAPNGGQTLTVGAGTTINWTATDPDTPANDLRVTIEYSINGTGGPFIPISSNEANDGAFQWTVPNTPASTCRVKLTVTDGALTATDLSNSDFTIQGTGTTSNTLSLGTGTGASGTQVVIPVSLDNDDVVKALQFDVAFTGSVVSFASVAGTGRGATMNASSRALGAGGVRIVLDYRDATTLSSGSGTIANLTFNLVGASGTNTNLSVSNLLISDPSAQAVESDALGGSINVEGGGGNGPTLDLFALKNPVRTRTLQIFLRSNQPLTQNPTVSAGSSNVSMTLIDAGENLYQGSIAVVGGVGSVTINAQGQSAGGTGTKTLTVNF